MKPASSSNTLMPAAFIGHGSPMNTLELNRYTAAWRSFGQSIPRPRAILVVSAHWFIGYSAVTAMARPRTIHDFFGFPQALFDVEYPAPGEAQLAEQVADLAKPSFVGLDRDAWGLDHGTWSVLAHMFPEADVPVVQLALNAERPVAWHVALGAKLAPLREQGVLILGSGNVVHNLRSVDWSAKEEGFDWNRRFDDATRDLLAEKPGDLATLEQDPDWKRAVPTPEHFLPLAYFAGLAAAGRTPVKELVHGYSLGALSMTSFMLDATCPTTSEARPAAGLPDPEKVPPEVSNA